MMCYIILHNELLKQAGGKSMATKMKMNEIPRGTEDLIGKEARLRDWVINMVRNVYEKYGLEPLYTPIIENAEVFNGHHGEGENLLFSFKDKCGEDLVLKYDSTVPLARVVSMHPEIPRPYKRYQFQESFRDDETDKGHYRAFIQLDADIVGVETMLGDAECVMMAYEALSELGFNDFTIRLNHRKIIKAIAQKAGETSKEGFLEIQRAIDYADKVIKNGIEGIRQDLERRNISSSVIKIICEIVEKITDNPVDTLENIRKYFSDNPVAQEGINELEEILSYIPNRMMPKVKIDFTLARGADYYTGSIFEAKINGIELGAVLGGGRFDQLVEAFSSEKIPAVGFAIGMERIIVALKELWLTERMEYPRKLFILDAKNPEMIKKISKCANQLRNYLDVSILYGISDYKAALDYVKAKAEQYWAVVKLEKSGEVKIKGGSEDTISIVRQIFEREGYLI